MWDPRSCSPTHLEDLDRESKGYQVRCEKILITKKYILYFTYVKPTMEYAAAVWAPSDNQ